MTFTASQWIWRVDGVPPHMPQVTIDRVDGIDGVVYAVRQCGACMDATGKWEREPISSSRTDQWRQRFRFRTWNDAAEAIVRHCKHPWGRFAHYDFSQSGANP